MIQQLKLSTQLLLYAAVITTSFSIGSAITSYAQNGTDTTPDDSLGGQTATTITAVVAIITSVFGIIKLLSDKGWLDKRAGTAAVMGADTAVAVLQTRELLSDTINGIIDVIKTDNPTLAQKIEDQAKPLLKRIEDKADEYRPKVNKFEQIAGKIVNKGENTVDAIKEDEKLKEDIPNTIVPTED